MERCQPARPATPLFAVLALSGALSFGEPAFAASPVVRIDGSSAVYPITELVAQEFQRFKLNEVHVNVGVSGTHGGFAKFCRGEADVASASRPILKSEMDECSRAGIRFYELPIAYDALTVVVNPQNSFVSSLSVDDLRRLWEPRAQGRINTWKDLNPAWPADRIKLYAPGADSGSFESFTEVIVGTPRSSRTDVSTAEDHEVLAQRVAADKDAIGYLSLDYYVENQKALKAVAISDGKEAAVLPSVDNVRSGRYQPLSRPLFLYVSEKSLDKPAVRDFVDFAMKNAARLVVEANYLPLQPRTYVENLERISAKKVGSVYGGESKARMRPADSLQIFRALIHGS